MVLRSKFILLVILVFYSKNCCGAPQGNEIINETTPKSIDEPKVDDADVQVLQSLRDSFEKLEKSLQPDLIKLLARIGNKFRELKDPAITLWKYIELNIAPLLGGFYKLIEQIKDTDLRTQFEDIFLKAHNQLSLLINEIDKLPKSKVSDIVHAFTTVPVMLTMLSNWRELPAKMMSNILEFFFNHMEI